MFWLSILLLLFYYTPAVAGSCGGTIYVESKTPFHSPNYPNSYPAYASCTWTISGPQQIRMRFEMFQVESCSSCQCDYLEVRDGNANKNVLLGKFCGGTLPPTLVTSARQFYITFISDSGNQPAGIRAYFEPVTLTCANESVLCTEDSTCISKKLFCDGRNDCPKGSDEKFCMPCHTTNLTIPYGIIGKYCDENITVEHLTPLAVTCKKGYSLPTEAKKSIQCVNGKWSNIPNCVPSCDPPALLPENAQFLGSDNATYFTDDQAFLKCSNGYFVSDEFISQYLVITCQGENLWTPNEFQCLPQNHFRYIYRPQPIEIIEADIGQTLILFCDQQTRLSRNERANLGFQWFKNTVDVRTVPNIMFRITAEGNLVLLNISAEYAGEYSCLLKEQLKYMGLSNVTYIVKMKTLCLPTPKSAVLTAHHNTSVAMFCPDAGSQILDPPVWYTTKGKRIFNNVKYSLISNFGLLLNSVRYADQGSYTCDLGPNTPFCERHFMTYLHVSPTNEDSCGLIHNSVGFPWLVTLWWNDEMAPFCYGTLVNERWVLTTAFCLIGLHRKRNPDVYVKFAQQSLHESVDNSTTISVEYAKIHPQYSRRINMADIGVVKLKQAVTYTNDITPICLTGVDFKVNPDDSSCDPVPPITGKVSGFGSLEAELKPPEHECMEVVPDDISPATPDGITCATGCGLSPKYVADTGSPFQVLHNGKVHLYGVFSWGERRSKLTKFDYFTAVHPYYKWIASYINRND